MSLNIKKNDEIRKIIDREIKAWGDRLDSVEITWSENESTYDLELHFNPVSTDEEPYMLGSRPESANGIIRIGDISVHNDDNWENFFRAGHNLYSLLKTDYPMLRKNLLKIPRDVYMKKENSFILSKAERERKHEIKLSVTGEQIENIIVTALEGGINYWAVLDNTKPEWANKPDGMPVSQYAAQLLLQGKIIWFDNIEDESACFFNLKKLLDGIRLTAVNKSWNFNFDDFDSITADSIFQYGIFGRLIYS